MSEAEYTINHDIDGWPICKNGEPIFDNKTMLAELHQLQARVKDLEGINLGITKTLVEMEAEKARLVGALRMLVAFGDQLNDNAIECVFDDSMVEVSSVVYWREFRLALEEADNALAAYRKED